MSPGPNVFVRRAEELKAALILMTRLPLPHLEAPPPQGRVVWAYPVAGAAIGLMGGFAMLAAAFVLPHYMAALLGLAVTVLITGALHEDGLADFFDGAGGRDAETRLSIMRDSRLGVYGALALMFGLLARLAGLIAAGPLGPLVMIGAGAISRGVLALPMRLFPPAREDGLTAGAGKPGLAAFLAAMALPLILVVIILPALAGLAAMGAAALAALAVGGLARRRLGGITGDVLGAAQQLAEIGFIWVMVAAINL